MQNGLKKTTVQSFSSSRIKDTHIRSSITMSALHPQAINAGEAAYSTCTRPQGTLHEQQYTAPEHLQQPQNTQYNKCSKGLQHVWQGQMMVVAGDNHVQVSPAYLCIHTRPVHKQYTPPFHPALRHCPSRATYLQTHPTVQGNNSLPVSLSPPHTSRGEGRLH